jgi:hypothetical protein
VEPGQRRRVHGTCVHYSTRGQALGHILSNCPTNPVQPSIHKSSISSPTNPRFVLLPSVLPGKHSLAGFATTDCSPLTGLNIASVSCEMNAMPYTCHAPQPTSSSSSGTKSPPLRRIEASSSIAEGALVTPVVCRVAFPLAEI